MTGHDPELEELRDKVHCAVVLERTPPPWKLDRKESTKLSLKYRRGKGEILIVSHGGRGWWDPTSDAKGDVFGLVQRLEPGLTFGHVRKRLREFAGLSPRFPPVDRAGGRNNPERPVAERWAERKAVWPNSPTWRYLARKRWLPAAIIEAASAAGVLREGPVGSAWFAHLDDRGVVAHVDVRGPTYKGSLTGGAKSLFRLPPKGPPLPRLVLAEAAIDALSVAAIESLREGHALCRDGRRHGPGHDRRARGAARQYRSCSPARFLQRSGRQWTGRPLRRPPPIAGREIQDPVRAASPANRGRRLERRPQRQIRNEWSEAMTMLDATAAPLGADARAFVLLKSGRRLDLLNPDPQAWTDGSLAGAFPARRFGVGLPNGLNPFHHPTREARLQAALDTRCRVPAMDRRALFDDALPPNGVHALGTVAAPTSATCLRGAPPRACLMRLG